MTAAQVRIEVSGPLFRRDASRVVREATRRSVAQLIELGESRLDQMLRPRPAGVYLSVAEAKSGASTGNYRRNVNTKVDDVRGVITDGGVVYGPWLEGTSSRNQSTRFKGYSSFRRVAQALNAEAPKVIRQHVADIVRELS